KDAKIKNEQDRTKKNVRKAVMSGPQLLLRKNFADRASNFMYEVSGFNPKRNKEMSSRKEKKIRRTFDMLIREENYV
ncbi:hypothetical protein PENTCL1PPCAC_20240, partial [Pristionchus entomophagus]